MHQDARAALQEAVGWVLNSDDCFTLPKGKPQRDGSECPIAVSLVKIDGFHWFRWVLFHLPGPSIFPARSFPMKHFDRLPQFVCFSSCDNNQPGLHSMRLSGGMGHKMPRECRTSLPRGLYLLWGILVLWVWLKIQDLGQTAGFGLLFHLPGFHCGPLFLTHSLICLKPTF